MGCQNSKLHADILAIPPKLRPILWRKVEEMRRRRSGGGDLGGTLSKKELLTDGEVFLPHSTDENGSSKPSTPEDSVSSSGSQPKPEKVTKEEEKEPESEERKETKEDENEERSRKDDGKDEERDVEAVKAVAVEKVVVVEELEEEEEEMGNLCPGSPSFRVYYIESLVETNEGKNDSTDANDMRKKWRRAHSVDSIELVDSNEDQEETKIIKKRGKNRMRLTRAICRGPIAVKHLLNVSSCYHPSNEGASLLTRKSAAPSTV